MTQSKPCVLHLPLQIDVVWTSKLTVLCSVERNASSSPFLRLPYETRNYIYYSVLGDRFIHLKHLRDTHHPGYPHLEGTLFWAGVRYPTPNEELLPNGQRWV